VKIIWAMINKDGQKVITTAWIVLLDQVRLKKLAKLLPNYEVLVRQLISADEKIKTTCKKETYKER
jgi:hypothetical protein